MLGSRYCAPNRRVQFDRKREQPYAELKPLRGPLWPDLGNEPLSPMLSLLHEIAALLSSLRCPR
jgi:hypothetical protein